MDYDSLYDSDMQDAELSASARLIDRKLLDEIEEESLDWREFPIAAQSHLRQLASY